MNTFGLMTFVSEIRTLLLSLTFFLIFPIDLWAQPSDSAFLNTYLKGDYPSLTQLHPSPESNLQTGLYAAALAEQGKLDAAKHALPHYEQFVRDTLTGGVRAYSDSIPEGINSYELFAIYRHGRLSGQMAVNQQIEILTQALDKEPENFMARTHRSYLSVTEGGQSPTLFSQLYDQLHERFPFWKRLKEFKAGYHSALGQYDSSAHLYKQLYLQRFAPRHQLNNLILTYMKSGQIDSADTYVRKLRSASPQYCSIASSLYYHQTDNIDSMMAALAPCLEQKYLPQDDEEALHVYYLRGLLAQGKYSEAEQYFSTVKRHSHTHWVHNQLMILQLQLVFYQKKYEQFKGYIHGGYGGVACPGCEDPLYQLTKRYYKHKPDQFEQSLEEVYQEIRKVNQ